MLSALFWLILFIAVIVIAMLAREHVREHKNIQSFYQHLVKDRLELMKKVIVYGTLFLWLAIWFFTRGEGTSDFNSLMQDFSSSWTPPETQDTPPMTE